MTFKMPELIIESIIRDGLNNILRDPTIVDDIFGDLTLPFASKKYGGAEIDKIKAAIQNRDISIVHAFNLVPSNMPCISIQLADDREEPEKAYVGNFVTTYSVPFTPDALPNTIKVTAFTPTAYNPTTGVVTVADTVNLAPVYANLVFVDAAGVDHPILGGIINDAGQKQFVIDKAVEVSLDPGAIIKTSIDYDVYQQRGNVEQCQIILGLHSKEALFTKYLYTLTKYFILSRRDDLIARGLQISTYTGSDFSRAMEYEADIVYTRFLHINGMVQHDWRSDKVQLVDNVDVNVKVERDRLGNDALKLTDQTIKVTE